MSTSIKLYAQSLLNLFVPRICPTCGKRMVEQELFMCARCLIAIPYARYTDFYDNAATRLFWGRIPIEKGYCHFLYRKSALSHPLMMQLKYNSRPEIGKQAGEIIAQELVAKDFFNDIDALIPVPLHWARLLKRGYNQSTQIARGIANGHWITHP